MKRCSACKLEKDTAAFSKNRAQRDGFSNQCKPCKRIADSRWKAENKDHELAQARKYYAQNPEKFKARVRAFNLANPHYKKAWLAKNPERVALYRQIHKEAIREAARRWGKLNAKQKQAAVRKYKLDRLRRVPPWADLTAIVEFYKNRPAGHHVDHIIPLRGKIVSGLHVLDNLQYLPAEENLRKGNKWT